MRIGYQGEPHSYSYRATAELFPNEEPVGLHTFFDAFVALEEGRVDRLVLPVENSTTGSVLPVLDRLPRRDGRPLYSIIAEHLVEARHAILGVAGTTLDRLRAVKSHPQALAQAEARLRELGLVGIPRHDTAGAVREVAEAADRSIAALGPIESAGPYGLTVLAENVLDKDHNTTRFFVIAPGAPSVGEEDDKTTLVFTVAHQPGALALVLTELGSRGANLTRIESRPSDKAWTYRFFVDLEHISGSAGLEAVLEPPPAGLAHLEVLGSYRGLRTV